MAFSALSTAPNLKGRPRKKKPSFSQRRDSQGQSGNGKDTGAEGKSKVTWNVKMNPPEDVDSSVL